MAEVLRDAHGVPHVRASSLLDLVRAQGEVTARDRTWQLEWLRRRATGTTAALVGADGVGWDSFARRTLLTRTARRAHEALDEETRAALAAYVDGLNAGLRDDTVELLALGAEPEPWEPWTPLATFAAQHVLFGRIGPELWRRRSRAALGDDAALLSHEGPLTSGSNAWVVGGARTASGRPLIGGDPHRTIESPGVYQQVRLACDDPDRPQDRFDVAGFTFVGLPGVQHFAHAGDVAWAITNAMADAQDLRDVVLDDATVTEAWTETVEVRGADPVVVEVLLTAHGPVVEGRPGGPGLALEWPSERLGDLGLGALLPLLRARTVADVDAALDHWVEPVNNAVVADVHGRVLYRIAGRVPTRDDAGTWTGWLDPAPREEVAADGEVVTANERRGPESAAVGSDFAPPHRADRVRARLAGRTGLTAADFADIHDDTVLLAVAPMLRLLAAEVPGSVEALGGWDMTMDAASPAAGALARWRTAFTRLLVDQPVLDRLSGPSGHDALLDPWLDVTARVGLALPTLIDAGTPFGIDLGPLARRAWAESQQAGPGTWGETHVFAPVHAFDQLADPELVAPVVPAVALDGDSDCVRCTGSVIGITDLCSRGSVARYVWDLAGPAYWVVPLGASGDPRSPHHLDQLAPWAEGRLVPVERDWDQLTPDLTPEP